uniref:Uncharacterized protein n=1 Tax=Salix viminalis TaxID=40686 RepID=A0A6N2M4X4_SALVM
MQELLWIWH